MPAGADRVSEQTVKRPRGRPRKEVPARGDDKDLDARLVDLVPDAIEPGYEAHQMRVAGKTWAEIARRIGSSTPSAAMFTVRRYLEQAAREQSSAHMQEALQTQVDRYEAVLRAWWPLATTGLDEKAALVVLRTLERLDRVLRITDGEVSISRETVVVAADPESYVKQLQQVVADRDRR